MGRNKILATIKYYWFIFRWFLIGRYHCSNGRLSKKIPLKLVWTICNRTLWGFITFSVIYLLIELIPGLEVRHFF